MATKSVLLRGMHVVPKEIVIGNRQVTIPVNRPCHAVVRSFVATSEPRRCPVLAGLIAYKDFEVPIVTRES